MPLGSIATLRVATEWEQQRDDRGKVVPVRVGLKPEQRSGVEYELDLLMQLDTDHNAMVLKDRTGKFQDVTMEKPGEDFGRALAGRRPASDRAGRTNRRYPRRAEGVILVTPR